MLSDTVEHREAMLSHSALKSVATLLRADDATLLLSAVKTVACFVNKLEYFHLSILSVLYYCIYFTSLLA